MWILYLAMYNAHFSKIHESWHNIPPEMVSRSFLKCRITNSLDSSEDDCAFSCTGTLHIWLESEDFEVQFNDHKIIAQFEIVVKPAGKVTLTLPKYCTLEAHCLLLNKDFCCGKDFSAESQGAQYIQVCIKKIQGYQICHHNT